MTRVRYTITYCSTTNLIGDRNPKRDAEAQMWMTYTNNRIQTYDREAVRFFDDGDGESVGADKSANCLPTNGKGAWTLDWFAAGQHHGGRGTQSMAHDARPLPGGHSPSVIAPLATPPHPPSFGPLQ